jgi:hypothetical protein
MKLTKSKLRQLILEALDQWSDLESDDQLAALKARMGAGDSIAGQDVPSESKYPEILDAFRDVLDAHLGVDRYNFYRELSNIAELSAKREAPGV